MTRWKSNLLVLCLAQLLTMMGFSGYFPSIPYYIQELGGFGVEEATRWIAAFSSGAAVAMMIVSPIWGGLADRYGRKLMLVRATAAGSILALAMAYVTTPSQLITLRTLQGIFCGTVSASMTMVATETPEESLGFALGIMQTVQFVGRALGPLVGGWVADSLGYQAVFPVSAGMMAASFLGVAFFVTEKFERAPAKRSRARVNISREALSELLNSNILILLLTLGTMSFAVAILSPILSLYVKALSPDATRLATLAGAMMSVSALTSSVAAFAVGRMGDRMGQKLVLTVCGIGVAATYLPQAFVSTSGQLLVLRTIQGIFVGGMMPTATALLARSTPSSKRGTVFGISNSVQAAGRAVGPMVGAAVANSWGLASTFLVTSGAYALTSAVVALFVKSQPAQRPPEAPATAAAAGAPGSCN